MSNGRKVSTDALETLGTIIDDTQKRDAIHIAVLPVVAGERLHAGQDVGIGPDGGALTTAKPARPEAKTACAHCDGTGVAK